MDMLCFNKLFTSSMAIIALYFLLFHHKFTVKLIQSHKRNLSDGFSTLDSSFTLLN